MLMLVLLTGVEPVDDTGLLDSCSDDVDRGYGPRLSGPS